MPGEEHQCRISLCTFDPRMIRLKLMSSAINKLRRNPTNEFLWPDPMGTAALGASKPFNTPPAATKDLIALHLIKR